MSGFAIPAPGATQPVGVLTSATEAGLEDQPIPSFGPDEALIAVTASALCGSEAMEWYGAVGKVLGHESAGVVVAVGDQVTAVVPGQRVFVNHHVGGLASHQGLRGHSTISAEYRATKLRPGTMAQYVVASAAHLRLDTHILPDSVPDDVATTVEPWSCVLSGLRVAGIQPGDTVLVLGAGFIGLGFVHLAPLFGAGRVISSEYSAFRRAKALELGANQVIDPTGLSTEQIAEVVRAGNSGRLADVVVVAVPQADVYAQARALVEKGGTIHLTAPGAPGTYWQLDTSEAFFSEVSITAKYSAEPRDTYAYLRLLEAGRIDPRPAITHHLPLSALPEAYQLLRAADQSLKIVLYPHHLPNGEQV
jgi:L-iditol 2-dehydrogenase